MENEKNSRQVVKLSPVEIELARIMGMTISEYAEAKIFLREVDISIQKVNEALDKANDDLVKFYALINCTADIIVNMKQKGRSLNKYTEEFYDKLCGAVNDKKKEKKIRDKRADKR